MAVPSVMGPACGRRLAVSLAPDLRLTRPGSLPLATGSAAAGDGLLCCALSLAVRASPLRASIPLDLTRWPAACWGTDHFLAAPQCHIQIYLNLLDWTLVMGEA